ncbi:chloride channel protein [Bacteriovorax sp. Seq25_V]|uniref:chloride channel protein n=1 Tax=Bacteriovorax sp. Seq25_V TaxID=1201288 RepID=UPI000389FD0F|nr:chloride channel protein [Bacteriovorax sp. Seq25_V]EQC46221.1 chloride transporter, ClC family [Bacteriovorax sp. Seq25_V]
MKIFENHIRWAFLSSICGVLAGISSAIFLILLKIITEFRQENMSIIWFLPVIGLAIGFVYFRYGKNVAGGNNLIIDEIHDPQKIIPVRMAPLILITTLLTHLFGGSAGREGTAVQMAASLSDQLAKFFKTSFRITNEERKILLTAGAGAGFGSAIGAPIAGVFFGMEVLNVGKLKIFALYQCIIASFVGTFVASYLNAPHSMYSKITTFNLSLHNLFYLVLAGIIFGLFARLFCSVTHKIEAMNAKFIGIPYLRPFIAGCILLGLYHLEGSFLYAGLGLETIAKALDIPSNFSLPFFKLIATSITVGSGFKGGEFIPLVFMGTTLGSALSVYFPLTNQLLGALGFAAVFGAAANAPLSCTIMAIELFGFNIATPAVICCFMAYYFSGYKGIYKSQKLMRKKHIGLLENILWLGELPRKFFKKKI